MRFELPAFNLKESYLSYDYIMMLISLVNVPPKYTYGPLTLFSSSVKKIIFVYNYFIVELINIISTFFYYTRPKLLINNFTTCIESL